MLPIQNLQYLHLLADPSHIGFCTGDHLAVYPENDSALVIKLGKLLDADLDTIFTLTNTDGQSTLLVNSGGNVFNLLPHKFFNLQCWFDLRTQKFN